MQPARGGIPRRTLTLLVIGFFLSLSPPVLSGARADCRDLSASHADPSLFRLHLSDDCSPAEREARSVTARDVLRALQEGKGIDLSGVVVTGDLLLDELPEVPVTRLSGLPDRLRAWLRERGIEAGRVIAGPIAIRQALVRGRMATRIQRGVVIVQGPLRMDGTVFEAPQDWSRVVVTGAVDWSNATLQQECLFLQAGFEDAVQFRGTRFGPHTRFHQAAFHSTASFEDAVFSGLAELLEVTFLGDASFARVRFEQGTGFSGGEFHGAADFAGAVFAREAYFLFTQFRQQARFEGARFEESAGFAEAEFHGPADFSGAVFGRPPEWSRARFRGERMLPPPPEKPVDWLNYGIVIGAGLAALVLFWMVIRR